MALLGSERAGAVIVASMWFSIRNWQRSVIRPVQSFQARLHVIARIESLADVVQQGRQQKLHVVRPAVAGQLEHLERMVENVAFGMMTWADCFTCSSGKSSMRKIGYGSSDLATSSISPSRLMPGYSLLQKLLQFADRGPLDGLAGDRAAEDVMGLVLGINGQLQVEAGVDVDVREDAVPRRA